ncbi:MAG TPA: 16S rRNA (cytosine(1402)-N(4))-methyltransferase, partial [Bacteroidales bacterium]|nr:16S rRNA (cytosine(1402)-N(4))-methyltransferase [Bacteroidales bacterium]
KHKLVPVNKKVTVPDLLEVKQNRRARSAKLRIAEKIADHTDESLI